MKLTIELVPSFRRLDFGCGASAGSCGVKSE
jgi:hypothetical protein